MAPEKKQEPLIKESELALPAESAEVSASEEKKSKISSELIMILIIGLLFGYAVKTEFSKRINVIDKTVYESQAFNFTDMQKSQDAANQAQAQAQAQTQGQQPNAPQQ